MSDNDVEDVSFLPGDSLNRKAVYEPSVKQRCKQVVLGKGRATAIVVMIGFFILLIALLATMVRPGQQPPEPCNSNINQQKPSTESPPTVKYIATNGESFPWELVRLPKSIQPVSYHIDFYPRFDTKIFTGSVHMVLMVKQRTDKIIFHIKDINITQVNLREGNNDVTVAKQLHFKTNQQYLLQTDKFLLKGSDLHLIIHFQGHLVRKLSGFYLSSYTAPDGTKRHLGTTQFEPTGAREAFPCFDEPDMKAKFSMSITRDKDYISLFNMPLKSSSVSPRDSNLFVDQFEESVKMSTYLVAFIVCDFANINDTTSQGTKVSVYAPKHQIHMAEFALSSAVSVLNYYNDLFGIKYPLPKQDLVAVPDFAAGAMENWGLITYRLTSVLYDSKMSSASDRQWVAVVIAHELAHQWFGNLVTMKWWDDLWLNEGFASFVEYLGADKADKLLHMDKQFVVKDLMIALTRDCLRKSHPIEVAVQNPDQINDIFDDISYNKGSSIIRMLRNFLGNEAFKTGIKSYLNKYKFGNAVTADLWNSLSEVAPTNLNITAIMNTWTKQMGYPVVTMTFKNKSYQLIQDRFLLERDSTTEEKFISPYGYKWHIPFTYIAMYTDGTKTNGTQWMALKNIDLRLPKPVKWIKGNHGMFGLYRVNYEESNWQALTQQLLMDHTVLPSEDRAGLLDDVCHLARSGSIAQTVALDMTKYLRKERDYLPWKVGLDCINYIAKRLKEKVVYDKIKSYTLDLMKEVIQYLGWKESDTDTQLQIYLRSYVLGEAIAFNHGPTVEWGRQLFKSWMENNTSLNVNLKSAIFRAGVQYGGEKEWKFIWEKYKSTTVPSEKTKLLVALCRTRDDVLKSRLMQLAMEGKEIRQADLDRVMNYVSVTPSGQVMSWRILERNWEKIIRWFKGTSFIISGLIKATTADFSSEFDYQEVKKFFEDHDAGAGKMEVAASLERIRMNIDWIQENEKSVTEWFENQSKS